MSFGDKCPICKRNWKSNECPHSYGEANKAAEKNELSKTIAKEVRRQLIKHGLLKDLT